MTPRRHYDHYIGGAFRPSDDGETFESVNPYSEDVNYTVAKGGPHEIDLAVRAARAAFESPAWRDLTASKRGRLLTRLGDLLAEHTDRLAEIETADNGKLLRESRQQLSKIPDYYHYFGGWADKIQGAVLPAYEPGNFAYTLREPLGVVGAIVPWNSPLQLATLKLAPALAAGNTVVVKPSEHTSASILEVMEIVEEAGFPPGVVNVVAGFGDAGAALAGHPGIDKVAFTGGTGTGRKVASAAAANFARLTLELGGKSPQIVFPDADPAKAATGIVSGIFAAAGQTCIAGSRAFVHSSLYDDVADRVVERAKRITIGNPLDAATELGPLCFASHREHVESYVAKGSAEGATLLTGGRRPADFERGFFLEPTVFGDVSNDMTIAQEEIFGPVLSVLRWNDEDDVVRLANSTEFGLAAGLWTSDVGRVHRIASRLNAGTVWVNKYRATNPLVPFGGFGSSGVGKENGYAAVDEYLRLKVVWIGLDEAGPADPFVGSR